jgi:hypothetical protein
MELTYTQDLAIQAKVTQVIGAQVFDRVIAGVRFAETEGPLRCTTPLSFDGESSDAIRGRRDMADRPGREAPMAWSL